MSEITIDKKAGVCAGRSTISNIEHAPPMKITEFATKFPPSVKAHLSMADGQLPMVSCRWSVVNSQLSIVNGQLSTPEINNVQQPKSSSDPFRVHEVDYTR
jgi:hypothetical protein